ncbi:MAG TPA: aquaporin [Nitrososphaeraceae archaeon]
MGRDSSLPDHNPNPDGSDFTIGRIKPSTGSPDSLLEAERVVPLYKRLGAELIGTFALVFAAVGSDISNSLGGGELGKLAVAAAPGLVIMAMIYGLDKISGTYFNPAISIGYIEASEIKGPSLIYYRPNNRIDYCQYYSIVRYWKFRKCRFDIAQRKCKVVPSVSNRSYSNFFTHACKHLFEGGQGYWIQELWRHCHRRDYYNSRYNWNANIRSFNESSKIIRSCVGFRKLDL